MEDLNNTECLSFGDALFLHLERPGMPLTVASLCIFEGKIELEACIKHIEAKLPQIPRYWQRVVPAPFKIGLPYWQYDPTFDIRNHVREVKLKHGTDAELHHVTSAIMSQGLDRQKPLWNFTVLTGLKGNRTGMLAQIHHCLADGISGIGLLNVIMDPTPSSRTEPTAPPPKAIATPQDPVSMLLNGVVSSWFSGLERVLNVESHLLQLAQEIARGNNVNGELPSGEGEKSVHSSELASLLPEFGSATNRLPFNVVCQGPQKFDWFELSFEEVRAIKNAYSVTVNDVVLTTIAMTMRKYAEAHRLSTDRILRIVVPVNVRAKEDVKALGNQITFVPVTVPLGIQEPGELLKAVHERTEVLKKIRLADMVGLAGTLLGTIPTLLQAFAGPIASQLPLSVCNLICTNVPGPTTPLYLLGHEMLACFPRVPIGGEMGMNCAVLTYNGKAFFGFTGDAKAIPDLDLLPKFLGQSFSEMRKSTGIKPARTNKQRRARPKKRVRRAESEPKPEANAETVTEENEKPLVMAAVA